MKPYKPGSGWDKIRQERLEATKEQRAKRSVYAKERREFLKARGICVKCGQRDAIPEKTLCPDCREKNNQKRRKKKDKPIPGAWYARQCERAKELRKARIAEGICVKCGKEKASPEAQYCHKCRARRKELDRAIRDKKIAAGLCVYCGHNKALPGLLSCRECRLFINQRASGANVNHTERYYTKERLAGRL